MKENRNIIRNENGVGHIQDNDYATPIISHRADPYIYKHTDGKYYFLGSHTDAGHNLNGTYQYLYIILRCADTLEDLTDNSGRIQKKSYTKENSSVRTVSVHTSGLLKFTISRVAGMYITQQPFPTILHGGSVRTVLPAPAMIQ